MRGAFENALRGLALAGALATCACGSSNAAPTQPSPAATPAAAAGPVVIYSSLAPRDSRDNTLLFASSASYARVSDDFTAPVTADARSISWDGGYCDTRSRLAPGWPAVPQAVARSFQITFSTDSGFNAPAIEVTPGATPLYDVVLASAHVLHERLFEVVESERACALYRFTASLSTPFPVVAGRKYWLRVFADTENLGIDWGWRPSAQGRSWVSVYSATYGWDMAFSLTSR